MAPEIHTQQEYNGFASDVWSLGVCLYAMVNGTVPFRGLNVDELAKSIVNDELKF